MSEIEKFVNKLVGDHTTAREAIATAIRALEGKPISDLDYVAGESVQRVFSAGIAAIRAASAYRKAKEVETSELLSKEVDQIAEFRRANKLCGRWYDHPSKMTVDGQTCLVCQPYRLDSPDFAELYTLAQLGWRVTLDDDLATYFPGRACCLILQPPKGSKLLSA